MITLHESNITSFPLDNGIGVLKDAIQAYAEEELNGMFEFYMEYDSEGHLVDELKEERIIKAKSQDKLGYQLFRIYSIEKNHQNDNLIVKAQHITYDLANNFVESLVANNMTKKQVMELIGSSTVLPHPFNVTSSNTTTRSSTSLYRTNPLQMVAGMEGSVLQIWGGQIERDNFNLILHDRRGSDDGVKVTYEKNITGLEATFDISGLVTRIFPFVYIEGSDNEPDRLITVNGKYIDSPHINDYEKIYIEPIDYSSDERIDTQDKTDVQIRQQLTNVASQYFTETGNDKVKVDMEVQFEHLWETEEYKDLAVLELVGMGDTVTINHSKLKVDATAIVNYIRYDCIAEKNEEVRLGSVKARLTDSVNRVVDVAEKAEQAQQTANQAIRAANGKNTIYYGPDEPEGGIEGDLWFRVVDGEYTRTYRHDGIQWQPVLSVDVRDAIDEAQQAKAEAQQAVDRANQATQNANDAITQAQTAFDEAQNALGTASNAYDIATTLQGDVTNLSTLVNDHTGQISSITQSVGSLTTRIGDAEGNISTLQQTSDSFATRISTAEGNISTLTATVNGLQTTVSNVQGDVSSVTQLASALQVRMTNAEGSISTLTQTATSLDSTIKSVRADLDGLEIGGRNLLLGTSNTPIKETFKQNANEYRVSESSLQELFRGGEYVASVIIDEVISAPKGVTIMLSIRNSDRSAYYQINSTETFYVGDRGRLTGYFNIPVISDPEGKYATVHLRNNYDSKDNIVIYKSIKLEKGNKATDWTPAPEDMATQSQFTQLADAINLRVMKGDVINQINISDESILIDGKQIHITGQTTIDNGVIKSAHIQSLDAGKITTGVLDAGKVSVINLNASNITSGSINANLITIANNKIRLDSNGLYVYKNGTLGASLVEGNLTFNDQSNAQKIGMFAATVWSDGVTKGISMNMEPNRYVSFGHYVGGSTGYEPMVVINPGTAMAGVYRGLVSNLPYRANDDIWMGKQSIRFGLNTNHNHSTIWEGVGESLYIASYTGVRLGYLTSGGVMNDRLTVDNNSVDIWQDLDMHGWKILRVGDLQYNSNVEYKTDIQKWKESALEKIKSSVIYEYKLKQDVEKGVLLNKHGLIIGDGYETPAEFVEQNFIDVYQMTSWSWKAIQELDLKAENIADDVELLKLENQYLRQKIEILEGKVA